MFGLLTVPEVPEFPVLVVEDVDVVEEYPVDPVKPAPPGLTIWMVVVQGATPTLTMYACVDNKFSVFMFPPMEPAKAGKAMSW